MDDTQTMCKTTTTDRFEPAHVALFLCVVALSVLSLGYVWERQEAARWRGLYEAQKYQADVCSVQVRVERDRAEDALRGVKE